MAKIAIIIQARMGSTRLPGKAMLSLGGTTIIGYLLNNLEMYGFSRSKIYVATSQNQESVKLVDHVTEIGFQCFVGSETNVLLRYQQAAKNIGSNTIVRLTGDNPFLNPAIVRCSIERHLKSRAMLTSTRMINADRSITRYVPKGSSVDIFQKSALMHIEESSCNDFDREHVVPALFRENKVTLVKRNDLKKCGIEADKIVALSIDTENDYKLACEIVKVKGI
jgi:spore coat polysaccharide biosynthesis protein SpsF (cytidylyltransferase family)